MTVMAWCAMLAYLVKRSFPNLSFAVLLRTYFLCWAGLGLLSTAVCADDTAPEIEPESTIASTSAAAMLAGDQLVLLDEAIERYQAVAEAGGWLPLDAGLDADSLPSLDLGVRDQRVRLLRQRLRLSGDYQAEMGADPLVFDAGLFDAVIAFQERHGMYPDGVLAGQTLELLNLAVAARIAQLQQARAAWADLPTGSGGRRVWVNIPEAVVTALNGDDIELQLRAVVGHPTRPTPELTSTILRVVVNPSWTVPKSIAGQDILPRQLEDAGYLARNGFELFGSWSDNTSQMNPDLIAWELVKPDRFPYRLRQKPGPANSLGRFKFDFPNTEDIYMHDTPSKLLLGLSVRSLSSGCIRVQDPEVLAQWLIRDDAVLQKILLQAAADPRYSTRSFRLRNPTPIDLVYLSAWVSPDGRVHFRRDVYGRADAATAVAGIAAAE